MENLYCRTPFSVLTTKEVKKLIKFVNEYCVLTFGSNSRKGELSSKINFRKKRMECYGWYDPNIHEITLFTQEFTNSNIGDLVDTYIHEYTHSLQPCLSKYSKLLKKHGYVNHPFEIEARQVGKDHRAKALSLYRKLNK